MAEPAKKEQKPPVLEVLPDPELKDLENIVHPELLQLQTENNSLKSRNTELEKENQSFQFSLKAIAKSVKQMGGIPKPEPEVVPPDPANPPKPELIPVPRSLLQELDDLMWLKK